MKVLLSYVPQFSKQYALMSCIPITAHESRNVIYAIIHTCVQSHYREVARWEIFMEQELRFGLDLGRFGNFWGRFFHVFMSKKKFFKNILDGENIFGIEWS